MKRLERDLLLEIAEDDPGPFCEVTMLHRVARKWGRDVPPKLWAVVYDRWMRLSVDCVYEGLPTNYDQRDEVGTAVSRLAHAVEYVREFALGLAGHVCVAHFLDRPALCGVVVDNGDNGLTFHTVRQVYRDGPYNGGYGLNYDMGGDKPGCLACILPHPNPGNIWRRINLASYVWSTKHQPQYPIEDAFHAKIRKYDWATKRVLDPEKSIFAPGDGWAKFVNPYGAVGECYPWCQCRALGPRPMLVGDCSTLPHNRRWDEHRVAQA